MFSAWFGRSFKLLGVALLAAGCGGAVPAGDGGTGGGAGGGGGLGHLDGGQLTLADALPDLPVGTQVDFRCPPVAPPYPSLWGTYVYTSDSPICAAGVHAGALGSLGGLVVVAVKGPQQGFTGSKRLGIVSLDYGAWDLSYSFLLGDGTDTASLSLDAGTAPRDAGVDAGVAGVDAGVPGVLDGGTLTPTANAISFRGSVGRRVWFRCPTVSWNASVYGSGIYTDDTAVCTAAVHAGVASPVVASEVTVEVLPGQVSYQGSTSNGLTSLSYTQYTGSYAFVLSDGGTTAAGVSTWPERITVDGGLVNETVTASTYGAHVGWQVSYWCPALNVPVAGTATYGTGVYTVSSSICAAAIHAGAMAAGVGGNVIVRITSAQPAFMPSLSNGVKSTYSSGGSSGMTFVLGDGGTTFRPLDAGTAWPLYIGPIGVNELPVAAYVGPVFYGTALQYDCPAQTQTGYASIWGTGVYTYDSRVCPAGVHAGALSRDGGLVTVVVAPGQPSYAQSTQNGLTSNAFGAYGESFYFLLSDGGSTFPDAG